MPRNQLDPPPKVEQPSPGGRHEWKLLVLVLLAAVVLRCLFLSRIAVEHFDEGVYASNLVIGERYDHGYPARHLFAPPLLPWLIEWLQVAMGVTDLSAAFINLMSGVLTVLLVWWVGRCWFGTRAGIAAACLASCSGVHILYSRTALTDPLLCFWLLAAVFATWCALRDGDNLWAVIAGVLTGLAWWTKYNGWLPIVIGLAGAIPWLIFSVNRARIRPTVICLVIIAATAFAVWWPALNSLPEGYSAVAHNHSRYLVGLSGWPQSLWRQILNHRYLDGLCGGVGLTAAVLIVGSLASPQWRNPRLFATAIGLGALAAFSVSSIVLAGLGTVWVFFSLRQRTSTFHGATEQTAVQTTEQIADRQLALWLLAAWGLGLMLTTPLYTAYPRLTLPLLVVLWLAGGAGIDWLVTLLCQPSESLPEGGESRNQFSPRLVAVLLGSLFLVVAGFTWRTGLWAPAWQSRRGMADVAVKIRDDVLQQLKDEDFPVGGDYVIDVYGEPSLYFQLRKIGIELVLPVSSLRFAQPTAPPPEQPMFLVTGPHAQRNARFAEQFETAAPRLSLVKTYEYTPSDLVLLNDYDPRQITDETGHRRRETMRLYRVR